jgi:hypothetical protein
MIGYEAPNVYRQIHTDGRKLPEEINLPSFYGYSTGHWEGDTLVVGTAGFNDKIPLDVMGHPRSESMRFDRAIQAARLRTPGLRNNL